MRGKAVPRTPSRFLAATIPPELYDEREELAPARPQRR